MREYRVEDVIGKAISVAKMRHEMSGKIPRVFESSNDRDRDYELDKNK